MNRLSTFIATLALGVCGATALAQDVPTILKTADRFRLAAENMQVETQIAIYNRDGSVDKERNYVVFAQAKHQTLVVMKSPAEKGQKVLMLGDDFWLVLPGSQRPIRITAAQRLFGSASTGDVATLSWSQDYSGTVVGEERCADTPCLHLSLQALRKSVNYQRIELWVGKTRYEPINADLYLQSDRLAKQARFTLDASNNKLVSEMVLSDQLSDHKETCVRYISRKEKTVPATWLNPMFLAQSPNLE